jgi:hypothetical protein
MSYENFLVTVSGAFGARNKEAQLDSVALSPTALARLRQVCEQSDADMHDVLIDTARLGALRRIATQNALRTCLLNVAESKGCWMEELPISYAIDDVREYLTFPLDGCTNALADIAWEQCHVPLNTLIQDGLMTIDGLAKNRGYNRMALMSEESVHQEGTLPTPSAFPPVSAIDYSNVSPFLEL